MPTAEKQETRSTMMTDSVDDSKLSFNDSKAVKFSQRSKDDSSQVGNRSMRQSSRIRRQASKVFLPRLITRDYPYHQSSNRVQVFPKHQKAVFRLYIKTYFYVLLRVPFIYSFPILMLIWYLMIWVFAFIYQLVDSNNFNLNKDCGLGDPGVVITIHTAYAFSLETCTTVGCEYQRSISLSPMFFVLLLKATHRCCPKTPFHRRPSGKRQRLFQFRLLGCPGSDYRTDDLEHAVQCISSILFVCPNVQERNEIHSDYIFQETLCQRH